MMRTLPGDELRPNTVQSLRVLMRLTVLEALGQHMLTLALGVAVAASGLLVSCSELAIFAQGRVLVDGALSITCLTPLFLTVGCALSMMDQDIGERCASALLAQPLSTGVWLLGRFLGLWAMMVAQVGVMAAVFLGLFAALGVTVQPTLCWAFGLTALECTIALALSVAARCMAQREVAWVLTLVLVGAGYLTLNPQDLRNQKRAQAMPAYRLAQNVVPQMQRINIRTWAAKNGDVPEGFVRHACLYTMAYSGAALILGAAALRRRRGH